MQAPGRQAAGLGAVSGIRREAGRCRPFAKHNASTRFSVPSPADPARRGGTLTVGLRDDEHGPAWVAALEKRAILVDHRPGAGLRVSPHFYTRQDELRRFAETLSELRQSRAWTEHVSGAAKAY